MARYRVASLISCPLRPTHRAQCSSLVASGAASSCPSGIASCSWLILRGPPENRFPLVSLGLLLPHHPAFDRRGTHPNAPGSLSPGPTHGHHPDTPFTQAVRVDVRGGPLRNIRAVPTFPQVAL
jgi:hypothetical protein